MVLEQTRTRIWEHRAILANAHPVVIYDPTLFPSYSYGNPSDAGLHTPLFSETPKIFNSYLSPHYQERIYQHLSDFDTIFILGGGYWRWNSNDCFKSYLNQYHPELIPRISWAHKFSVQGLSKRELLKIAEATFAQNRD